jgi:hypothetical protein
MGTMTRTISLLAASLLACAGAFGQASSAAEHSARTLPQDRHEGLTVSADPYKDAGRAKDKFGKASPLPVGILPVEVFLHNETTQAIRVDMSTIQLAVHFESGRHQEIDWVAVEEVAAKVAHPKGPPAPRAPRFPVGLPSGSDSKTDTMKEILAPLALDVDVVPPMATIRGFLFFDLNHDVSLAERASLYVPDVTAVPSNKQLMFFEVPLGER